VSTRHRSVSQNDRNAFDNVICAIIVPECDECIDSCDAPSRLVRVHPSSRALTVSFDEPEQPLRFPATLDPAQPRFCSWARWSRVRWRTRAYQIVQYSSSIRMEPEHEWRSMDDV
jgi:hypothetical protein